MRVSPTPSRPSARGSRTTSQFPFRRWLELHHYSRAEVLSIVFLLVYDAVAVTMPHIPFRQTQSISENPAFESSATWSVNVV